MPGGIKVLDELVNTYNLEHNLKSVSKIDQTTPLNNVLDDVTLMDELR